MEILGILNIHDYFFNGFDREGSEFYEDDACESGTKGPPGSGNCR